MQAIVLAGGFAKRMWPLTKTTPKHLLPINNKPMLEYTLDKILQIKNLSKIYITTNLKFQAHFEKFIEGYSTALEEPGADLELIIEDARSEGEKLGSIGALYKLITEEHLENEELVVVGGDNLFGFELTELHEFYRQKNASVVALYDIRSESKAKLYGVVEVDENKKVIDFQEKPEAPSSTLVSTACYIFNAPGVNGLIRYIEEGNNPDALGFFIKWLYQQINMFGYVFQDLWFDIGSIDVYNEADRYYAKKAK